VRGLAVLILCAALGCESRRDSTPAPSPPPTTTSTAPAPAPVSIDPPATPGALAPNLHATADGVLATWLEPTSEGHRLRFSRWRDGTWSEPVTVTEATSVVANWADVPTIAAASDGALVTSWAEKSGAETYAYDALVARSTDGGSTWQRLGPLHDDGTPTEHGFVSLVPAPSGVRAFWLDGRATADRGPMTIRTAVVGESVQSGEVIDGRVCDCCGTAAVSTPQGPLVAFRDRSDDDLRDISVARRDADGWTTPHPVHRDGWQIAGCPVNGPALAADGDRVAIAWYTYADSTHRVRAAFSDDAGATFGAPIEVDAPRGSRAPLGRVSIALAPDGTAIVGWLASDREDAAVLVRRVGRDGAVGAELRLGGNLAGRDAGFPRLARNGGDLVAIWTAPGPSSSALRAVALPLDSVPRLGSEYAEPVGDAGELVAIGRPAPSLEAVALDGTTVSLSALRGKVVLLNLWATWCEPCRHELPLLAALHEQDAGRGLAIVAVNIDRKRARDEIAEYVARRKLPFAIWLDAEDRASTVLGASTYPFNLLIGRDGTVRWRRAGAIRADDPELRAAIEAALAAP
jgi:thiol-disulfide isomerase/thioredoxin